MTDPKPERRVVPEEEGGPVADAHNMVLHDLAKGDVRNDPAWRKAVGLPPAEPDRRPGKQAR